MRRCMIARSSTFAFRVWTLQDLAEAVVRSLDWVKRSNATVLLRQRRIGCCGDSRACNLQGKRAAYRGPICFTRLHLPIVYLLSVDGTRHRVVYKVHGNDWRQI